MVRALAFPDRKQSSHLLAWNCKGVVNLMVCLSRGRLAPFHSPDAFKVGCYILRQLKNKQFQTNKPKKEAWKVESPAEFSAASGSRRGG